MRSWEEQQMRSWEDRFGESDGLVHSRTYVAAFEQLLVTLSNS